MISSKLQSTRYKPIERRKKVITRQFFSNKQVEPRINVIANVIFDSKIFTLDFGHFFDFIVPNAILSFAKSPNCEYKKSPKCFSNCLRYVTYQLIAKVLLVKIS